MNTIKYTIHIKKKMIFLPFDHYNRWPNCTLSASCFNKVWDTLPGFRRMTCFLELYVAHLNGVIRCSEVISKYNWSRRIHQLYSSIYVFDYHVVWKCAAFGLNFFMVPIAYRDISRQQENFVEKKLTFHFANCWCVKKNEWFKTKQCCCCCEDAKTARLLVKELGVIHWTGSLES